MRPLLASERKVTPIYLPHIDNPFIARKTNPEPSRQRVTAPIKMPPASANQNTKMATPKSPTFLPAPSPGIFAKARARLTPIYKRLCIYFLVNLLALYIVAPALLRDRAFRVTVLVLRDICEVLFWNMLLLVQASCLLDSMLTKIYCHLRSCNDI